MKHTDPDFLSSILFSFVCGMMLPLMLLGITLFNASLGSTKNSLSMMVFTFFSLVIASIVWPFYGFIIACAKQGNVLFGYYKISLLKRLYTSSEPHLLRLNLFKGLISCAICVAILSSAPSERGRFTTTLVFMFFWILSVFTLVYYWLFNKNGWGHEYGIINDCLGGLCMCVGASGLVYSWYIGKRHMQSPPHNHILLLIGLVIMFVGSAGFGGLITGRLNTRSILSIANLNISALTGGMTSVILHLILSKVELSVRSFAFGSISAFVGVSCCCTSIEPQYAVLVGALSSLFSRLFSYIPRKINIDDYTDIFSTYFVSSLVGYITAPIFITKNLYRIEDSFSPSWYAKSHGIMKQISFQALAALFIGSFSAIATLLILLFINKIMRLKVRENEKNEEIGSDIVYLGQVAYPTDTANLLEIKHSAHSSEY